MEDGSSWLDTEATVWSSSGAVAQEFLEGRAGMHELARRHNLSRNLIRLWIQRLEAGELGDDLADAARIAEYEGKIADLERKVGQLTMESTF